MFGLEPWQIAIVLKPFAMLIVAVVILIPARMAAERYIPEGRLKRVLLRRV